MALVRLVTTLARLDEVAKRANTTPIVLEVRDADTVISAASLKDRLSAPLGVWLSLSNDYLAQLAARDVATLSWLIELDVVVVSGAEAVQGAEVVRALLSDDEVNFANDVATLRGAYNRPAPPRPVSVWSWDGEALRNAQIEWHVASSSTDELGEFTTYD
jgi:hypothetical protein